MRWHAHVTVAAVIENQGRFLMIEENAAGKTVFNQPAGHLEKDETLIDAVVREVLEETAWEFQPTNVIGVYLYPSQENSTTYLRVCFSGAVGLHYPERTLDKEIIQAQWMTRKEIEKQERYLRSPLVLKCIDDYLADKPYPLTILTNIGF